MSNEHLRESTANGVLIQWVDVQRYVGYNPVTREILSKPMDHEAAVAWMSNATRSMPLALADDEARRVLIRIDCIWPFEVEGVPR